ncbi:hypothetical protein [Millisia brevis]|uniref:hypothetical protein n=1 Tax=Millisia brevis TaxID=264148 RepID=UPI0012ED6F1A|nr:hypothetical protein [Millisia brevis]
MSLITADEYEYEIGVPEVTVQWGLHRTVVSPDGDDIEHTAGPVSGRLEIEQIIDARVREIAGDLARVSGSTWIRRLHHRDGTTVVYEMVLEVTDWRCLDCRTNMLEIDEYFMVHDDLWLSVVPDRVGHLCIGCLEGRLGRRLTPSDFIPGKGAIFGRATARLRDRLGWDASGTDS